MVWLRYNIGEIPEYHFGTLGKYPRVLRRIRSPRNECVGFWELDRGIGHSKSKNKLMSRFSPTEKTTFSKLLFISEPTKSHLLYWDDMRVVGRKLHFWLPQRIYLLFNGLQVEIWLLMRSKNLLLPWPKSNGNISLFLSSL